MPQGHQVPGPGCAAHARGHGLLTLLSQGRNQVLRDVSSVRHPPGAECRVTSCMPAGSLACAPPALLPGLCTPGPAPPALPPRLAPGCAPSSSPGIWRTGQAPGGRGRDTLSLPAFSAPLDQHPPEACQRGDSQPAAQIQVVPRHLHATGSPADSDPRDCGATV